MTRHRFEAYLDKVFGFSERVGALPEGREFPQHSWNKMFDAVFLGAAMHIPSLLQIEAECHEGALAKRIGPIRDDTLGYALQRQSPEPGFALSCEITRRLKRKGVLRSDWSRGLVVGAVDGIEICSSFARCGDACMEREVQHKVNGEMKTDIQYYHRIVAVALKSTAPPSFRGFLPSPGHYNLPKFPWPSQLASNQPPAGWADGTLRNRWRTPASACVA